MLPTPAPTFYTVTNRRYFPGTVALLSSIQRLHPESEVYVFCEQRKRLTPEQVDHLREENRVKYIPSEAVGVGEIKEAWQLKAHAAHLLSREVDGMLIHVDSDAILCSRLDSIIELAWTQKRVAGGRDGFGVRYSPLQYRPYCAFCDNAGEPPTWWNGNYISTSVLFLPLPDERATIERWSRACDNAAFGPENAGNRIFFGHGDQGVLNAVLFFSGRTPIALENSSLSEHWVHGRDLVEYRDGSFWKGRVRQLAFHSVGGAPKFWATEYPEFVREKGTLDEVLVYWLSQLFQGPCGIARGGERSSHAQAARRYCPEAGYNFAAEYALRSGSVREEWVAPLC